MVSLATTTTNDRNVRRDDVAPSSSVKVWAEIPIQNPEDPEDIRRFRLDLTDCHWDFPALVERRFRLEARSVKRVVEASSGVTVHDAEDLASVVLGGTNALLFRAEQQQQQQQQSDEQHLPTRLLDMEAVVEEEEAEGAETAPEAESCAAPTTDSEPIEGEGGEAEKVEEDEEPQGPAFCEAELVSEFPSINTSGKEITWLVKNVPKAHLGLWNVRFRLPAPRSREPGVKSLTEQLATAASEVRIAASGDNFRSTSFKVEECFSRRDKCFHFGNFVRSLEPEECMVTFVRDKDSGTWNDGPRNKWHTTGTLLFELPDIDMNVAMRGGAVPFGTVPTGDNTVYPPGVTFANNPLTGGRFFFEPTQALPLRFVGCSSASSNPDSSAPPMMRLDLSGDTDADKIAAALQNDTFDDFQGSVFLPNSAAGDVASIADDRKRSSGGARAAAAKAKAAGFPRFPAWKQDTAEAAEPVHKEKRSKRKAVAGSGVGAGARFAVAASSPIGTSSCSSSFTGSAPIDAPIGTRVLL